MAELLLELFSEEIPARMQARAADELKRLVCEGLTGAGLVFESADAYVTPRRLALHIDGLPDKQPDVTEEKKGPKVGAPEQALAGFMKANGLASIGEAELRKTDKGEFYFAVRHVKGRPTGDVLSGSIAEVLRAFGWPKSMRWADYEFRWIRPMHNILCVFEGQVVNVVFGRVMSGIGEIDAEGSESGWHLSYALSISNGNVTNTARGHRFLAPEPFEISSFADYEQKLRTAKVILDREERKKIIAEGAAKLAKAEGLTVKDDPALLDEVTGLVEWPVVLLGSIDADFMDLPPEVLTTAMRSHQKYFTLLNEDGSMAPRFALVSNMETDDGGAQIIAGNERVLRARLADARFFWDQDRKVTLSSRTTQLADITFHAKLGTLDVKVDRMQALAVEIAKHIDGADRDRVRAAARLAKADLVTGMVGEFPELQGLMGRYYALADGEHEEVADAIRDHYAPQGPNDACPSAPVSVAVALADKIDTLAGFWAIDEKPTGSKDPFALRRAALGVIRLVMENKLRAGLLPIFEGAFDIYFGQKLKGADVDGPAVAGDLLSFFADRVAVHLRGEGVRHDLIAAVFALGGEDDLVRLLARVEALQGFIESEDGANLLTAFRRAANILRIEEKKDGVSYDEAPDKGGFVQDQEAALGRALKAASTAVAKAVEQEEFTSAMAALAALRGPVDAFFDEVTVNADDADLRVNRLRLLSRIRATMGLIADFSQIEG